MVVTALFVYNSRDKLIVRPASATSESRSHKSTLQ